MDVNIANKKKIKQPQIPDFILNIVDLIVRHIGPEAIILFGSYATGKISVDSDLDLLVIVKTDLAQAERIRQISRLLQPRLVPMDIIVKTPTEIKQCQHKLEPFLHDILNKGILIYARSSRSRQLVEKSRA